MSEAAYSTYENFLIFSCMGHSFTLYYFHFGRLFFSFGTTFTFPSSKQQEACNLSFSCTKSGGCEQIDGILMRR